MRSDHTNLAGLVAEAARTLDAAGVEQPRAEARWLLARVLGVSESALLARPDSSAAPAQAARFLEAVRRRAAREPFAYVVGERDFYGRTFVVDRRVLIPRPETETLIAEALAVLADRSDRRTERPLVVDVGCGSGVIACTLASEAPSSDVVACDLSAEALTVAALNVDRLGLRGRVALVRGDLLEWLRRPVDLVVANLPYVPTARFPALMPEVANWEPRLALDGGMDGLHLIRRLLADVPRVVRLGGTVLLELDPEQADATRDLLPNARSRVVDDLAGLGRVVRLDLPA
jgi:release factor glutamine methyltransferase